MRRISSALFFVLLWIAPTVCRAGEPARRDYYGDHLPPGVVARLGTMRLRQADILDLTFSKDGKQLMSFGRWDKEVRVWDMASGRLVERKRLKKEPEWVHLPEKKALTVLKLERLERCWVIALAPGGKRLAAIIKDRDVMYYEDGSLRLWDMNTGRETDSKVLGESLAFSPDGKTLAVGKCWRGLDKVYLLDATTLKETGSLPSDGFPMKSLAFSPDGRFLAGASGGWDVVGAIGEPLDGNRVLLWDLKGTKKPRKLIEARVNARFAFTPDSKTLACASILGSEIFLWDTASGRQLLRRPGHGRSVEALAVSPDDKLVASSAEDALCLWKAATGQPLHEFRGRNYRNHLCLFSPDGKRLISAEPGGALQVRDVATGKNLRHFAFEAPRDKPVQIQAAGISADGKTLSAVFSVGKTARHQLSDNAGQLIVWDLNTGKEVRRRPYKLESHPLKRNDQSRRLPRRPAAFVPVALVNAVFDPPPPEAWGTCHAAFAPGGKVVSVWLDKQVGLAEVSTGRLLMELPRGVGRPLVFSPDGRLVAASLLPPRPRYEDEPTGVSLIEVATGQEIFRLTIRSDQLAEDWALAFTPDGSGLVVADRKSIRVWDTDTGGRLYQRMWPEEVRRASGEVWVRSLAVLPGGRAVTGTDEGEVLVWDLAPASWPRDKPVRPLGRKELDALWSDLTGDVRKAHRALHTLASVPTQALPLLSERLRPTEPVDTKQVEQLLTGLDNRKFAEREKASRELAGLRDRIEPLLRRALQGRLSKEARRRLEAILTGPALKPSAETRRTLRALVVLERIGAPQARRLLEKLAGGADAHETREAKAALERLSR
jgi:WD40 repeat protein